MKSLDYKIGDKCLVRDIRGNQYHEIIIEEADIEMIKEYENTSWESFWYKPLNK